MTEISITTAADGNVAPDDGIVSMLTDDEKALYYKVAAGYKARGAVLEIGPWLGSGTFQICSALETTGHDWSLTVIDRFVWSQIYANKYPRLGLTANADFLPNFKTNLAAFGDRVVPIAGELLEIEAIHPVAADTRFELVFVDAPKSWRMLWSVLQHLGPHLMIDARLVFQDFFHITSRQIIWLLASVPQLRITDLVDSGTAAAFVLDAPIIDMASIAPATIEDLGVADLIALWERLKPDFEGARLGALAAGMALDLLARDAHEEARQVLEEGARDKPWSATVLADVDRLARIGDDKSRDDLQTIAIFLRTGIGPAEVAADRTLRGTKEETSRDDPFATMDREALGDALAAIRSPRSAPALAITYQMQQRLRDTAATRTLLPAFEDAIESGAVTWFTDLGVDVRGLDIGEIGSGPNLHGLVCRAMGARSHVLVDAGSTPEQRTVRGERPGERVRLRQSVAQIAEIDGAMRFATDAGMIADASLDLVIVRHAGEDALRDALATASRVLRPGGRLQLDWFNPLAWRAHGEVPREPADFDPDNEDHRRVADWRHAPRVARTIVPLANLAPMVRQAGFDDVVATRLLDTPDILLRLTPRVRRATPGILPQDLVTTRLAITATWGQAEMIAQPVAVAAPADQASPRQAPEASGQVVRLLKRRRHRA